MAYFDFGYVSLAARSGSVEVDGHLDSEVVGKVVVADSVAVAA